jgi:hypothetical protein
MRGNITMDKNVSIDSLFSASYAIALLDSIRSFLSISRYYIINVL